MSTSERVNSTLRTTGMMEIDGPEAHVWTLSTDVDDARFDDLEARLSREERARAARMRHAGTRNGFVVARSALRRLLAGYLGEPADGLELRYSSKGKPVLVPGREQDLRFSVAHSGGLALIAFARMDVGVDIERIRTVPRERRLIMRVFPQATRAVLAALPAAERREAFFAAWTQREALVKAIGGALLATHDPLDFQWPHLPAPRHFEHAADDGATTTWTVAPLPQPAGFAATLVAQGTLENVRLLPFDEG